MKTAIYARFSSDKQRETSIEDQCRGCLAYAERHGLTVVSTYADEGISGTMPLQSRQGSARLLADAYAGRFDVLILEGLERLSRDRVEQEQVIRRFEHRGIVIIGTADGYDSRMNGKKLHRGFRGIINEVFLDDLREKTHRGQLGQVHRGYVAGGKSYGYDIIKSESGSQYQINAQQAETVRYIFEQYASGISAQRIAASLNNRGIASPRNNNWAVSAIYGSRNKGSGILNNQLYIGKYNWNRSQWIKDPDTGKRQRFDRKREEWQVLDVPHLRIIDDELWSAVQARMTPKANGTNAGAPNKTLFGGLMSCPHCNGAIIAINSRYYGCNTKKDRGTCVGVNIPREQVDARLLSVIKEELLSPSALEQIEREVKRLCSDQSGADEVSRLKQEIAELEQSIAKLVDAVLQVGISESLSSRLKQFESKLESLKLELTRAQAPTISPSALNAEIRAQIKQLAIDLQSTLKQDTQAARRILAELFGKIQIQVEGGNIYAEYENATERLLMAASGVSRNVVAGAGFINKKHRILLYKR